MHWEEWAALGKRLILDKFSKTKTKQNKNSGLVDWIYCESGFKHTFFGVFSTVHIYIAHPLCGNCTRCGAEKLRTKSLTSGVHRLVALKAFSLLLKTFSQRSIHYCQDTHSPLYTSGHHLWHECSLHQTSSLSSWLADLESAGHLHWLPGPGAKCRTLAPTRSMSPTTLPITFNSSSTFQGFRHSDSSARSSFKTSAECDKLALSWWPYPPPLGSWQMSRVTLTHTPNTLFTTQPPEVLLTGQMASYLTWNKSQPPVRVLPVISMSLHGLVPSSPLAAHLLPPPLSSPGPLAGP